MGNPKEPSPSSNSKFKLWVSITAGVILIGILVGYFLLVLLQEDEQFLRNMELEPEGKFNVSWRVDEKQKEIIFEILAKTKGWVGFGINPSHGEGMNGSDIVTLHFDTNGRPQLRDRHGVGNALPPLDKNQSWHLVDANRSEGIVSLKVKRALETCDSEDVPITWDSTRFIWAFSEGDEVKYHGADWRGSAFVHILDPPSPPLPPKNEYKTVDILANVTLPAKDTVYWCGLHSTPTISGKHHIIALGPKMDSELARRHSHHLELSLCEPPPQIMGAAAELFFKGFPEGDCFEGEYREGGRSKKHPLYLFCNKLVYSWAMGGDMTTFPEKVGLAIGEAGVDKKHFFMLQVHLDNPGSKGGQKFLTGVQIAYTDKLRETEAGILKIQGPSGFAPIIPPDSKDFLIASHCPSQCTNTLQEKVGMTIFNVQMHAHSAARKMRLRHFRNGEEFSPVSSDERYSSHFQESRKIHARQVLPGDHLTLECTYDNRWRGGKVTLGGYSTEDEMCQSTLYYYPKSNMTSCGSFLGTNRLMQLTKIQNLTSSIDSNPMISAPTAYKGLRLSAYLNNRLQWTPELRAALQKAEKDESQIVKCEFEGLPDSDTTTRTNSAKDPASMITEYPHVTKHLVINEVCNRTNEIVKLR